MRSNKDTLILNKIIEYCDQIAATVERFGNSYETFYRDFVYQNACAMCILQIGELTGKLSEEMTSRYPNVPWRGIKATRNIFAHTYGDMDLPITWDTIQTGVPSLKASCENILSHNS